MSELLQDLIAAQAERQPKALAVAAGAGLTTYGDLERRSNRVARVLREHGCRRASPEERDERCPRGDARRTAEHEER